MKKTLLSVFFILVAYPHNNVCMRKMCDKDPRLAHLEQTHPLYNKNNKWGDTILHMALRENWPDTTIKELLPRCCTDLTVLNHKGESCLDLAMHNSHQKNETEILKKLLNTTDIFNAFVHLDDDGKAFLKRARDLGYFQEDELIYTAEKNETEILKLLLNKTDSFDALLHLDRDGKSLLKRARDCSYMQEAELIYTAMNIWLCRRLYAHQFQSSYGKPCKVVKELFLAGAGVNAWNRNDRCFSVNDRYFSILANTDAEYANDSLFSVMALPLASTLECTDCMQLLLHHNPDLRNNKSILDKFNEAYHLFYLNWALTSENYEAIPMLAGLGVQVNKQGECPLLSTITIGSKDGVFNLLNSGALVTPKMLQLDTQHMKGDYKDRLFIIYLLKSRYNEQKCYRCDKYQKELQSPLNYIPCKNIHNRSYVCKICYEIFLIKIDGKKKCPVCQLWLEQYPDLTWRKVFYGEIDVK